MGLLRGLAQLVTFVVLVALAACGLAVAVFSVAASGDFSLPGLAKLIGLPGLSEGAGRLLRSVEADGGVAAISALAGLGAVVLGALLLAGTLAPRRERLVVLGSGDEGTTAARRRVLRRVAGALAEQARGVTATKVKLRARRRARGGRLTVRAAHPRTADPKEVERGALEALDPLAKPFGLKPRIRPRLGRPDQRVQ